jgi:hypothetical protein
MKEKVGGFNFCEEGSIDTLESYGKGDYTYKRAPD